MELMAKGKTQAEAADQSEMQWDLPGIPAGVSPEALPRVNAEDCVPNQECNLTPGCRGRIRAYNTITQSKQDQGGKIHRRRIQQLACTHCYRCCDGFRVVSQPTDAASQQLWNRHKQN